MDFARHVKTSVDILQVVGDRVRLKKQGARYVGLCPFHSEKTPSFSVHPTLQFFKCFGCGKGGDVFNFLMEIDGVSFFEALKTLAEQHGIPMPKRGPDLMADEQTKLRAAIYQMHEAAERFFVQSLDGPEGKAAQEYLRKRGLDPGTAAEFGLGYAPGGGRLARLLEKDFAPDQLEAGGLVVKNSDGPGFYDRFRNRLMFPIAGETGKLIAFAGRALEAEQHPKYLNSPESPIYKKSHVLYNLNRAREYIRKRDCAILVEGYMDVIGVWSAGIREVVATCGTALTYEQIRMLGRHTRTVTVNFDPDVAGSNAAERSIILLLDEGLQVRVLSLPGGLDPDEFCRREGAEAYELLVNQAPNYYFWLADRTRQRFDTRTAEGRVAAFHSLMPAVNRVSNKIERVALVNDLADRLGVEPGLVLENFRRAAADRREPGPPSAPVSPLKPAERLLIRLMVEDPEARRALIPDLERAAVIDDLPSAGVFRALLALAASGDTFELSALEARLPDADKKILAEAIFGEDVGSPDLERGRAALAALEGEAWRSKHKKLHKQILDAQRSGNFDEAVRLARLKQEIEQRLAAPPQVSH